MSVVKLNISLDEEVAGTLRRNAREAGKPASRYLAELIKADEDRRRDQLAIEGYGLLSGETCAFAEAALRLADETWPEWRDEDAEAKEG
jgi:hypothetical protein